MKKNYIHITLIAVLAVSIYFVRSEADGKSALVESEKLYTHYCAPCHGVKGDGNGFNAKNLDPRPANHTDTNLMTKRTDVELFGAINGGGRGVGKSTLMPPWGETFDKARIESLVKYLRELCRCEGE